MRTVFSLWPLFVAAAILLLANGLQNTVLTLRAIDEGFPTFVIGFLLSFYFLGFITGCRFAPGFIARVGHIRSFVAFASMASAAAVAHAVVVNEAAWLALRIVTGFSFAALQMILESWLNESADNASRGRILSIYRITDFTAVTLAQVSVGLFNPEQFTVFAVLTILLSLALVPVALTRVVAPPVPTEARLNLKRLWTVSPLAAAGAVGVGITSSSFWSMGPVFVRGFEYGDATVGYFVGAIIFGGAIAQWPIGLLSDRIDRRKVMVGSFIGGAAAALLIPGAALIGQQALIASALLFGAFALPGFGLAIAHANDHAQPGQAVSINGGLLMLYGLAAVTGPIIAPQIIGLFGVASLWIWVASLYTTLAAFCFYRMSRRAAPETVEPYVAVPRTSPAVFALDPRFAKGLEDEVSRAEAEAGAPAGASVGGDEEMPAADALGEAAIKPPSP